MDYQFYVLWLITLVTLLSILKIWEVHLPAPSPLRISTWKWCQKMVLNWAAILKFCVHPFQRYPSDSLRASPHIANFHSEMVSKNCANFVMNCAAISKFALFIVLQNAGGEGWAPETPIPQLRISTLKWCQKMVLNWAAIFKFCTASLPEISFGLFESQPPHCKFSLRNSVKKLC